MCKLFFLKFGVWNVRIINDSDGLIRFECVIVIICKELDKVVIDICVLSEVCCFGIGNFVEKSYIIFWSGSDKKEVGVGFVICNDFFNWFDFNLILINDCIFIL